jgi:predicted NAD/FAD-dependent oxidoreductase
MAVIATPAEQASALLGPIAPDLAAHAVPSEPCWTLMLAFSEPLGIVQDCWRGEDVIRWAARNNSKPCRTAPETWVVQAGPGWSRTHVEATAEWVAATLKAALSNLLGIVLPCSVAESAHRWRFARSGAEGSGAILDPGRRLGICGDWLIGPRVEAAWLSGSTLAEKICVQCSNEPAERIQ